MLILLLDAVSVLVHTLGFLLLLALVSLSVEPDEEDEVKTAVEHQNEVEADRKAAGRMDEGHDPMNKHNNELDELHGGEVPVHKLVTNFRLQTIEEHTSSTRDASGPWGRRRTGSSMSTSHNAPGSSTCRQKSCYRLLVSRS